MFCEKTLLFIGKDWEDPADNSSLPPTPELLVGSLSVPFHVCLSRALEQVFEPVLCVCHNPIKSEDQAQFVNQASLIDSNGAKQLLYSIVGRSSSGDHNRSHPDEM